MGYFAVTDHTAHGIITGVACFWSAAGFCVNGIHVLPVFVSFRRYGRAYFHRDQKSGGYSIGPSQGAADRGMEYGEYVEQGRTNERAGIFGHAFPRIHRRAPELEEMTEILFELKDVRYSYLGKFPALCGIDLTVRRGEKIAIIGANGTGKSTLLHLLDGLIFPYQGDLKVFGSPDRGYYQRCSIGA